MSKAVLFSIRPKWCDLIVSRIKKLEIRKRIPKLEPPYKCYIYETQGKTETPFVDEDGHVIFKGRGEVIAEFICDRVYDIYEPYLTWLEEQSCVDMNDIALYKGDNDLIYGLHISDLKVYDKPKSLSEFKNSKNKFIERAFQSWGYVEEI